MEIPSCKHKICSNNVLKWAWVFAIFSLRTLKSAWVFAIFSLRTLKSAWTYTGLFLLMYLLAPQSKQTFAWFKSYYLLPSFLLEQTCLLVEQSTIKFQWGIFCANLLRSFLFESDHPCSFHVDWLCSSCSRFCPNLFCVLNRTGNTRLSSLLHSSLSQTFMQKNRLKNKTKNGH